jgi:tetratricopeptide (TPR) repeat protein
VALTRYREGLRQHPHSLALLKAAGRLSVALGWADASNEGKPAIDWLEEAVARNTTDFETRYYLGLALVAAGRPRDARAHFEAAQRFRATRVPATLQLARLAAAGGDLPTALEHLQTITSDSPRSSLPKMLEVAVLRLMGRDAEARERARLLQEIDPGSTLLRHELTLLGDADADLWPHLGADANRVLDLVDQYLALGAYRDALNLLEREYPRVDPPAREVGAVAPMESPLVAYYRGFVRERLGASAKADYAAASRLATRYTFPSRRSSYAVLKQAVQANPEDATARFLLGSLYLSGGLTDPAVDEWQRVRRSAPATPTLHRNLGLALLQGTPNYKEARAALEEGITADSENVEVYLTLDGVLSATSASPRERVTALQRFPSLERMPSPMVFKLAMALAEAGDADAAERLFHDRFFPKEEGGTSVRAVYAQVRLTSARGAADGGTCPAALGILEELPRERQDLDFTAGGLADALRPPTMARQIAAINGICGRRAVARAEWQRLERALTDGGPPMSLAIADEARQRLGGKPTPEQRRRLEAALGTMTRALDTGDTSSPGYTELVRAALLSSLGRGGESRQALTRVFLYPDRNLSHAWAHRLMLDSTKEIGRQ